ncbi:MAG: hypothetical protein LC794_19570 [Acidobacteria bacterium]|nr:hypothetical protein [Acidobacteriota bacterium]
MNKTLSRRLRFLSIALFVTGVVSAVIAYALPPKGAKTRPAKGFTIVTKETIKLHDPKAQANPQQSDYVITVRSQKSDGTWKEVRTAYKNDGKVTKEHTAFGIPGDGVFQDSGKGELEFLSAMPGTDVTSLVPIVDSHSDPKFVRDEVVQGYNCYVLRYEVDKNGSYEEEFYARELDNYPIRSVKVAPHGVSTTEMVQITLGNPADDVFTSVPKKPVKYEAFKNKIKALEEDGKHGAADSMRRDLDRRLAKAPQ